MKKERKTAEIFRGILDLFYPRVCCGCGNALWINENFLCVECQLNLPKTHWHTYKDNPAERVLLGRADITRATSFLYFRKRSMVQTIMHHLKYKNQTQLGFWLGYTMGMEFKEIDWLQHSDLLLPIPLHPEKMKKRGYNQSEWICRGLAKGLQKSQDFDILSRVKNTETQTKKSRFQRQVNLKNAFRCEPIEQKKLVLIDDVMTTGATFEAAAAAIKKANPECQINIVSLAIAD